MLVPIVFLQWNKLPRVIKTPLLRSNGMKHLAAMILLGTTVSSAFAGPKVIYGIDNRRDVFETSNALHLKLAKSTAAMVEKTKMTKSMSINSFDLQGTRTLERGLNICSSEKFSQQPLAATCSGFLVGNDTIVTAGHCYKSFDLPENVCKNFSWVFDYNMKSDAHDPTKSISIANIYHCKSVVKAVLDNQMDYAIIKLDRPVVGREPLKFRTSGKIDANAPLMVIGHPSGLPTKISDGARVTRNDEPTRFSSTLDTFQGNSGSAVFNSQTGLVEGILIMGKNDYVPNSRPSPTCMVVNQCDENAMNCTGGFEPGTVEKGEVVLRIEKIAALITAANVKKKKK
jgi:V8-like Glu-specific endopeptidase